MEELALDAPYYEYKPGFQIEMAYKIYYVAAVVALLIMFISYTRKQNIGQNRLRREYLV